VLCSRSGGAVAFARRLLYLHLRGVSRSCGKVLWLRVHLLPVSSPCAPKVERGFRPPGSSGGNRFVRSRDFDALIAHLGELGVLDREDLVIMHRLPPRERLPYVRARAPAAVDRWLHPFVEGWT